MPSNDSTKQVTADEAIAHVRSGRAHVVMSVGGDPDDPICVVYRDRDYYGEDMILTTAVAGWSEGVTEAVCETGSTFLREFLGCYGESDGTKHLVLVAGKPEL